MVRDEEFIFSKKYEGTKKTEGFLRENNGGLLYE